MRDTGRWAGILSLCLLIGCGADPAPASSPASEPEVEAVAPATGPVVPEPVPAETSAEPAPTTTPPVDLLHAVGTELAVSSAYRDQASQVARLVDGDLATA